MAFGAVLQGKPGWQGVQSCRRACFPAERPLQGAQMPFCVSALIDNHLLIRNTRSAKEAFAKAVDWHVKQLPGVRISNGIRSYSVLEFAEAMALLEMTGTISTAIVDKSFLTQATPD
jgi:hypothetical protein